MLISTRIALVLAATCTLASLSARAQDPLQGLSTEVAAMHKLSISSDDCNNGDNIEDYDASKVIQVNANTTLSLVACWPGAYQTGYRGYLQNGKTVTPVTILSSNGKQIRPSIELTDADFDAKTGLLATFAKGRGSGDCGEMTKSTIGEDPNTASIAALTTEIRFRECTMRPSAPGDFPIVFKQK
jgi:hypothetical protein